MCRALGERRRRRRSHQRGGAVRDDSLGPRRALRVGILCVRRRGRRRRGCRGRRRGRGGRSGRLPRGPSAAAAVDAAFLSLRRGRRRLQLGGATAGAAAGADEGCCGGRGFASRSRTAVFAARSNPSCCHHCTIRESRVSTSASIRAACRGAQGVRRCVWRCGSRGWPRVRIPVGGWGEKEREGEWEGEGEGRLVLIRAEFDEGMPERGIQLLHAQQAEDERDCVPASLLNPVRANLLVRMRGAGTRMSGAERTGKALGRGSPTRLVRGGCQRAVGPCCRGETPRPLRSGTLAAG